jgi:hypothetical protein
MHPEGQESKI